MKKIPLTQGKFAIVDDADFEKLSQHKWYFEHGYARRDYQINNKKFRVYMHRVIEGSFALHTDHINGDSLDNRRDNLRPCTASKNLMNRKKSPLKSSQYKGVRFFKRDGNWSSQIMKSRKSTHLGYFNSEVAAAEAYNAAAIKYFGEFARINDIRKVA